MSVIKRKVILPLHKLFINEHRHPKDRLIITYSEHKHGK